MKICFIEESPEFGEALRPELQSDGISVVNGSDLKQVLGSTLAKKSQLVVLNHQPHGKNDHTHLDAIRKFRKEYHETPLLVLSSVSGLDHKLSAFEHGADDYAVKPIHASEVKARIKALLRRNLRITSGQNEYLEKGGLKLFYGTLQIQYKNKILDLTSKEFQLLRFLMINANKTIPREEILKMLWGGEKQDSDNSLNVLVNRLRKKTGNEDSPVRTDWGKGYSFRCS